MAATSLELSLSLKPSYVPRTIANLLNDISKLEDESEKLLVLNNYLLKYQEELRRVEVFKRELPQCMLLLIDAIQTLKAEIMNIKETKQPESRQLLMEFLSMKRKDYEDEERITSDDSSGKEKVVMITSADQLWNPTHGKKQKTILEITQAPNFVPIQPCRRKNETPFMAPNGSSSLLESADQQRAKEGPIGTDNGFPGTRAAPLSGLNLKTDPKTLNYHPKPLTQAIWKNNRRSWSDELHARFVEALNILGGAEVATPKQIKEVMQVEGLTNDQVKSHLQKYRLHIRLPDARADPNFMMMMNADDPWAYY